MNQTANGFRTPVRARDGLHIVVALALCGLFACGSEDRTGRKVPDVVLEAGFGVPCVDAATCPAACVPHAGDAVCTQACDVDRPCPAGWSCFAPGGGEGVCLSAFADLCRPCVVDADCTPADGTAGTCVDYGGEGRFCGTPCTDDTSCSPAGDFVCRESGGATSCVRPEGICPCTSYLERLSATTACQVSNDFGTCGGERSCTPGDWTACSARVPGPDIDNEVDDDCDGTTDEAGCRCGDEVCNAECGETIATCPCDCATEGDGVCSPCGESPYTAPVDCCRSPGGAGCGDGFCLGFGCGENPTTCPRDCSTPCGNRVCEPGESPFNCAEDCQYKVCGNGICESTDGGPETCPGDCAAFCGNCECEPDRDESVFNCPIDCGFCGDGVCSVCATLNEDRESCAIDCCDASPELCNGLDDDCDGETDEVGADGCVRFFRDADRDGLGRWDDSRCVCAPTLEYRTPLLGDCDDTNAQVRGGSAELCNELDDDCDGSTDEDFRTGDACDLGTPCVDGVVVCDGLRVTVCAPGEVSRTGTLCGMSSCEGSAVREASRCNAGACVPGALTSCVGFLCVEEGVGGPRCAEACESDTTCDAPYHCAVTPGGKACAPDLALGEGCGRDAQCASGLCRDGVCCESACESACESCANAGAPGRCRPVVDGTDPDDDCGTCRTCDGARACRAHTSGTDPDEDCDVRPPCGETGVCDGDGACRVAGDDVVCGVGLCVGSTALLTRFCTGMGACEDPRLESCEPYRCAPDGLICSSFCVGDVECAGGTFCKNGACLARLGRGATCGRNAECGTGRCVDGVCCDSPCAGLCERCDGAVAGTCSPVDGDFESCDDTATCVAGACLRVDGERCGTSGQCASGHCVDGVCCESSCGGTCVTCASGTCEDVVEAQVPGECDGELWCRQDASCGPITGSSCSESCPAGRVCVDGACQVPEGLGSFCEDDLECASGACSDGVCCESSCLGECRRCRADGRCEYVPAGTEGASDCPAADEICGIGGQCLGTIGSACLDGDECASGHCADGVCCGSACDGVCESCSTGQCLGVAGVPDGDSCPAPSLCFGRDRCLADAGTACTVDGECASGTCAILESGVGLCCDRACDGPCESCFGDELGVCSPVFLAVNPGRCEGLLWCDAEADCVAVSGGDCDAAHPCAEGFGCVAGVCAPLADEGEICAEDAACVSGHCVDFVCCESACEGECQRCDIVDGQCLAAETGSDPDAECGAGTCSREAGGCAGLPGAPCDLDGECVTGHCEGGLCCDRACDGACELCMAGVCMPTSGDTATCRGDLTCVFGVCLGDDGKPCTSGAECASGSCSPESLCCAVGCTGPCDRCLGAGGCERVRASDNPGRCEGGFTCDATGTCVSDDERCMMDGECELDEWCDVGTCVLDLSLGERCWDDGQCVSGQCVEGVCCDGECQGLCESCALVGSEGICKDLPLGMPDPSGMCADGVCNGQGGCVRRNGAFCMSDVECRSGICADNTCCDERCDGTCEACDVAGSEGMCKNLDGVQDTMCMTPFICRAGVCGLAGTAACINGSGCPPNHNCVGDRCIPVEGPGGTADTIDDTSAGCVDCDTRPTCVDDTCR